MIIGRRSLIVAALAGLLAAATMAPPAAQADSEKATVSAIVEGFDTANDRGVLYVTGDKIRKFKTFSLQFGPNEGGGDAGEIALLSKTSKELTFALPTGLAPGTYTLTMAPKVGAPCVTPFTYKRTHAPLDDIGSLSLTSDADAFSEFSMVSTTEQFNRILLQTTGDPNLLGQVFSGVVSRAATQEFFAGYCDVPGTSQGWEVFDNTASAYRLFIQNGTGNVGIGTAAPSAKLHVNGEASVGFNLGTGGLNVNGPGYGLTTVDITAAQGDTNAFAISDPTGGEIIFVREFGDAWNFELFQGDAFKPGGGSWGVVSDARLKKDVADLDGALDSLLKLRSVTFEYKDPAADLGLSGRQTGFIAQEVEQVFPDWVGERQDGMKYVSVKGFESLTVAALRELRSEKDAQIATLEERNAELERRVAELETAHEARLAALEKALLGTTEESVTSPTQTSPKPAR